jgi:hypothetical protein
MINFKKRKYLSWWVFINFSLFSIDAMAYIDPSSMILGVQAIIAAIVSGVIWMGKPIERIKKIIKKIWDKRA